MVSLKDYRCGASAAVSAVLVFEVQAQNRMPAARRLRDVTLNLRERSMWFFIWEFRWLSRRVSGCSIRSGDQITYFL